MDSTKPKGEETLAKRKLSAQEKNSTTTKKTKVGENEPGNVNTGFKDLPDVIMIKIIGFLPMEQWASLEHINHQFQQAAFEMWRTIKEIDFDQQLIFNLEKMKVQKDRLDVLKSILEKLVLRAPNIKSINGFFEFTKKTTKHINGDQLTILAQFPALERVSLAGARFSLYGVTEFLINLKNRAQLKEVNLSMDKCSDTPFIILQRALDPNSNLPIIKFDTIFYDVIGMEFSTMVNVSELTTLHFDAGYGDGIRIFNELIGRCTQLRRLDLKISLKGRQSSNHILGLRVLIDALKAITTMPSRNLSILKLRSSKNLKDFVVTSNTNNEFRKIIGQIGHRFRLLELSLLDSYWANDATVLAIADHLLHLTSLELVVYDGQCKSESLVYLVTKMAQLEKLKFTYHGDVVSALATNLTKLKSLEIIDYYNGNSETFACLNKLSDLKNLRICGGTMSKETITGWSESGKKFESLELPLFVTYDEEGFIDFIKTQDRLRRLNLEWTSITDAGLKAIASSCPLLNYLNLFSCDKITLEGVQAIVDGCTTLKRLVINNQKIIQGLIIGKYRKIKLD